MLSCSLGGGSSVLTCMDEWMDGYILAYSRGIRGHFYNFDIMDQF